MFSSDAMTMEGVIQQAVGAASTTRFWSNQDKDYPNSEGVFLDENARNLAGDIVYALKKVLPTHDDQTLKKVYDVLMDVWGDNERAISAIGMMQNRGILFREQPR